MKKKIINIKKKYIEEKYINIINKPYKIVNPDDTFLICYISGTMDNPKGAMVTARSLTLAINVIYTIGYHLSDVYTILSFLPLAHIMEQLIFTECLLYGTRTGFSSGKINLGDDSSISVCALFLSSLLLTISACLSLFSRCFFLYSSLNSFL